MLGIDQGQRFAAARRLNDAKACVLECARANVARRSVVGNIENQRVIHEFWKQTWMWLRNSFKNSTAEPVAISRPTVRATTEYVQSENRRMLTARFGPLPAQARRDRQEKYRADRDDRSVWEADALAAADIELVLPDVSRAAVLHFAQNETDIEDRPLQAPAHRHKERAP